MAVTTKVSPEDLAALMPDERVTQFTARDVALPGAGTMALITLDNGFDHTRPTTFGPQGLLNLRDTLDAVDGAGGCRRARARSPSPASPSCSPSARTSARSAGSPAASRPWRWPGSATTCSAASASWPFPTFAFVNGAALGGGVEIALHCTYRTLSAGVTAIALPECFLGLVPGWGGTYLLPRLAGPRAALDVMVANAIDNNRMLGARQAHAAGFCDVLVEPADFLERSVEWAAAVVRGDVVVERTDHTADAEAWEAACTRARRAADARLHGAAPAAYRAVELVAASRTVDRDAGFAAEDEALADLAMSDEFRAGVYAFDLTQRRAKRPAGAPQASLARPVTKVGVVGAGLMASQLALLFVQRLKVPVVMTDLDAGRVEAGVARVHGMLDERLAKGRLSPDAANRLKALVTGSTSKDGFADADLVIEAVFEEMAVKQQVLAEVEAVVGPDCVLATNTSSLSVSQMASRLAAPRARRRPALLQPGGRAAAGGGRPRREDGRRHAGHGLRGRQGAAQVVRAVP